MLDFLQKSMRETLVKKQAIILAEIDDMVNYCFTEEDFETKCVQLDMVINSLR